MKRLSQTWRHKKNVNSKLSTSTTSKELVFGEKNLKSDDVKRGFKSQAAVHSSNTLRQTKILPQNNDVPVESRNGPCLTSPNGSLSLSFGFEFDAAALSEMDRLEQEHVPTATTTPVPHKGRATKKIAISTPQVNSTEQFPKSSSTLKRTPFGMQSGTLKARERISTPIEDTEHGLVSPTANLSALSPVNLTTSAVFNDGNTEPDRIKEKDQINGRVLKTTTCIEPENIREQEHRNGKLGLSTSDESSKSSESTSSAVSVLEIEPSSGGDVLNLNSWGLPPSVLQRYHDMGITNMFEWQAECLRTGNVLRGGNLVYSAPTSAGKTMVAELLMLKRVLETKRKALFILPYVSVAREKMFYLQRLFQEASVRVEGFMGSHSPAGGFTAIDIAVCTIEKANSLLNRLLEENKVSTLGVVVVDEMHMIGDPHRGYLLELFLTKILFVTGERKDENGRKIDEKVPETAIQIVCMSATLPNLDMLARWLSADLYFTSHRPVPLTEMVKVGPTIYDNSMKKIRDIDPATAVTHDDDHVIPLCKETISGGHSVLIFCPTKNWCEKQAEAIARHFANIGHITLAKNNDTGKPEKSGFVKATDLIAFDVEAIKEVLEQLKRTPVGLDSVIKRIVPYGVAYHHAGLTVDERDIIEGAFRQGTIRVLVATSTLCSGVNLPARRVIIRTPTFHGKMVDPLVYKQMAGRAGRKGVDDLGESILVCKATEKHKATVLIKSELKAVQSCLLLKEQNGGLKRALLEVIAGGVVTGLRDVERYAACTFFASSSSENESTGSKSAIDETIRFLVDNEFIRVQMVKNRKSTDENEPEVESRERYVPTQLGAATVASALSPDEALVVFAELQKARKCFVLESELHIIYQVTPIYVETQWPNLDWNQFLSIWERLPSSMRRVADIVGIQEVYLSLACRGRIPTRTAQHRQQLRVHRRFFAALALQDLVHEVPLNVVARRYGATRGMVQSLQGSASTFAGMVTVFCQRLGWQNLDLLLSQFQSRLSFGVERELCDLVRISVLNAARARMLYNAGFQTIASLASAKSEEVETVLRNAVPFVSGRKHLGETDLEVRHRREARVFWVAGKRGLSEKEAAELIVKEAKKHLQDDVAQLGIAWKEPQASVTSSADGEVASQSASRNAGGSTCEDNERGNKRKNTGRRRSSGSYRKSRKSPPCRRQKSSVSNTTKSSFSKKNSNDKTAKTATDPKGGSNEEAPCTSMMPEESCHVDGGKRTALVIQKDDIPITCKEDQRRGETALKVASGVGHLSTNFQASEKIHSVGFVQGFAQDQGKCNSSSDTVKATEPKCGGKLADRTLDKQNVEKAEILDQNQRQKRSEEKQYKTTMESKETHPRNLGPPKFIPEKECPVSSSTGKPVTARPLVSTMKNTNSSSNQDHHRSVRTNQSNSRVSCSNYGISKFLSRDSATNQNDRNLVDDEKDCPNKVISGHGNSDFASHDDAMTNEISGNLFKDKEMNFPNKAIDCRGNKDFSSRDGAKTNQIAGNLYHVEAKSISNTKGQEEKEKTRKNGCLATKHDFTKKQTDCSRQQTNFSTDSIDDKKKSRKEHEDQLERHSEAMDILCSLTSKDSNPATNESRDVFPTNEAKSCNKRRSPRTERSSDESPKEKIPRRESYLDVGVNNILCSESMPRQKESNLSATESFSVQEESCSSAVLFDNSADVSESRPNQLQGAATSPELYSEPLEDETNKPPSDERKKAGEVFESQALGFSMSDSYLAQCGGLTQMGPRPLVQDTEQRSPPVEQLEFDGISSVADDVMAKQCGGLTQMGHHPLVQDTEQRSSPVEQLEFDGISSISDDVIAKHCDLIGQETFFQEENGPVTMYQAISETEDIGKDNFFQKTSDLKRGKNADEVTNQGTNECNDDVIGEFDSCHRCQSTGRFNPSEPSSSQENTCSFSPNASTTKSDVGKEEEHNSGSFTLNLSLSESVGDETELQDAKDLKKGEKKSTKKHDENCFHKIDTTKETLDEKNKKREDRFTSIKPKDNETTRNLCHKTPKRNQEKNLQKRNLVVETPESDLSSQVTHSNQTLDSSPGSLGVESQVTHSNQGLNSNTGSLGVESQVIHSNQGSDSTPDSPCVDSPASPSCTFTSVSIIDVSANDLLFHTFVKEWKTRKEFSFAVGIERVLDNVPKIGGRFNKSPSITQGSLKGLPIEGTDEVVVGIAVCWSGKDAYYVSLKECDDVNNDDRSHDESVVAPNLSVATRIEGIKSVLEYKGKRKGMKFCFDSSAQYKVLAQCSSITLGGELEDPKIAAWLLDPSSKEKTLHQLAGEFISDKSSLLEGIGAGFGTGGFGLASQNPTSGRARSCTEAVVVYWLMKQLRLDLKKDSLDKAFYQVEMPVMKCLARMELNGIGFSNTECDRLKSILQAKLRTLEEEAYRLANHSFSLTSPDEVAMVLYVELKLPADGKLDESFSAKRRTLGSTRRASANGGKRGRKLIKHPSTNKEVLERLKSLHPLPGVILEWRRINCALTKVVYPVQREKQINSRLNMSRIYSTSQTHTCTGRVSFAEPNLQNVPRDFDIDLPNIIAESPPQEAQSRNRGYRKATQGNNVPGPSFAVSMRTAFIPFKGGVLLAADYSQLELRLITHLSRDERLLKLLNTGGDVFKMIAGSLNGIEPAAVNDIQRQRAKQICYGIIYGIGAKSLGEQLEVSEDDASVYIEKFKSRFNGIKKYLKTTVEDCRKNGFVMTVSNRRRYLPAINSTNVHARSQAERQAVNTTVQGSAADLVKIAMINIDRKLTEIYSPCRRTHRHKYSEKDEFELSSRRKSTRISAQIPRRGSSAQSIQGAFIVLQLHDELILEVAEEDLNRVAAIVKKEMENAIKLSVVLPVKLKAGPSWGTMNPIEL